MLTLSCRASFDLVLEQKTMAELLQRVNTLRNKAEVLIKILKFDMYSNNFSFVNIPSKTLNVLSRKKERESFSLKLQGSKVLYSSTMVVFNAILTTTASQA